MGNQIGGNEIMSELTIHQIVGDEIASPYNQNMIMGIIGKPGQGKSNAAIDIAYKTSIYLSERLGGEPEDYFTIDNMAIMSMDSIIDIMKNIKKQNIYVFDDIGGQWNAREFAKKKNRAMNSIIQTFRNWNTGLILTMPDITLIDSVPRNLFKIQIEMTKQAFHIGRTYGKLSYVKRLYKVGKNLYPYPVGSGEGERVKYVRCEFERAPDHLINEYEKRRNIIQEIEQQKYIQVLEDIDKEEEIKVTKHTTFKPEVERLRKQDSNISERKMSTELGCSREVVSGILKDLGMK